MHTAFGCLVAALLLTASALGPAAAHDPVSGHGPETLLGQARAHAARAGDTNASNKSRAAASCALGDTLGRLVALLNRDLAAHGGRPSLSAAVLVGKLKKSGLHLVLWPRAARYRRALKPYKACLDRAPDGPHATDARAALLLGRFADSFITDPLKLEGLDWPALAAEIAGAERFLAAHPGHGKSPDIAFILAANYARAARLAPRSQSAAYAKKARAALDAYHRRHKGSMKGRAARVLLERLPPARR